HHDLHSFPTRRSSDLRFDWMRTAEMLRKSRNPSESSVFSKIYNFFVSISRHSRESLIDLACVTALIGYFLHFALPSLRGGFGARSEEHTSELQSRRDL